MKLRTKKFISIAIGMALFVTNAGLVPAVAEDLDAKNYIELMGSDRYQTAIELSKHTFAKTANAVIIASGESYPDALAGSTLASVLHAPLILTKKNSIKSDILLELARLKPKSTYILGGRDTISEGVEKEIKNVHDNVERLYGVNRYDTSVKIAEKVRALTDNKIKDTVIVNGKNFPDALSAGALGAKLKAPLILTNGKSLPTGYENVMNKSERNLNTIVGGPDSVDIPYLYADRISGINRYETSAALAQKFFAKSQTAVVASGLDYPDGLSSVTLYHAYQMPILLTNKKNLNASVINYLNLNDVNTALVVGGMSSIGVTPRDEVKEIVNRHKFKVKSPEIVTPLEDGDTAITVKLNERPSNDGMVELYKLDKDGKVENRIHQSGSYKTNAQNTSLRLTGFVLKKGEKYVARRVETINKVKEYSRFSPIATVGENMPTAEKELAKLSPIEAKLTASDSENTAAVVNALRDAVSKNKNLSSSYRVALENYYVSIGNIVDNKRTGKIKVTVTHMTNKNDTATKEIDFTIKIVSNSIDKVHIIKNVPSPLIRNNVEGRRIPITIVLQEDGVVPDADKKIKTKVLIKEKGNNGFEEARTITFSPQQEGSNTLRYIGLLDISKDTSAGTIKIHAESEKNPKVYDDYDIEYVSNDLKGIEVKKENGDIVNNTVEYSELSKPMSIYIKANFESAYEKYTLDFDNVLIDGDKTDLTKVSMVKAENGEAYKLTLTDNNTGLLKEGHKFGLKLKVKKAEGNASMDKVIYFQYISK